MADTLLKLAGAAFLGSGAFALACLSVWVLERARREVTAPEKPPL